MCGEANRVVGKPSASLEFKGAHVSRKKQKLFDDARTRLEAATARYTEAKAKTTGDGEDLARLHELNLERRKARLDGDLRGRTARGCVPAEVRKACKEKQNRMMDWLNCLACEDRPSSVAATRFVSHMPPPASDAAVDLQRRRFYMSSSWTQRRWQLQRRSPRVKHHYVKDILKLKQPATRFK